MRSNGAAAPPAASAAAVPEQAAPSPIDWKVIAEAAMQQRDRASQTANNLEINLVLANAKIAALERYAGMSAAAAMAKAAQQEEEPRQSSAVE